MSQIWMITGPREVEVDWTGIKWQGEGTRTVTKRELRIMLEKNDCHKWQLGFEVGEDGYRHYQGRVLASNDDYFDWCKAHIPSLHVEKGEVWCDYETKSGCYITSEDFTETRKTRFGTPTDRQRQVMNQLKQQSVREVDVWYDPKGNMGKSWLVNHLWETRQAHYISPTIKSVQGIVQDVCSKMQADRRPYILIDIPRSWKWTEELYTAIEQIKDGLVDDPRYSAHTINIRGVKVLVMTNTKANVPKLSVDRWVFNGTYVQDGKTRKQRSRERACALGCDHGEVGGTSLS